MTYPGGELSRITTGLPGRAPQRSVPDRIVEQVRDGLDGADSALRALDADPAASGSDYEVNMLSAATCTGSTLAEVLHAATLWARHNPSAHLAAVGYRRIRLPEPVENVSTVEHRLTLALSYEDGNDDE